MKNIFLAIQDRLSEIPALKYIDKDWGQLRFENPPVKFPCALIDMANADFKQMGRGFQQGDADITVTVADIRLVRSSAMAPRRENAYAVIDLLDEIHQALQLFSDGQHFSPMMRTNLQRVDMLDKEGAEVYVMTYRTSFTVEKRGKETVEVQAVTPAIRRL